MNNYEHLYYKIKTWFKIIICIWYWKYIKFEVVHISKNVVMFSITINNLCRRSSCIKSLSHTECTMLWDCSFECDSAMIINLSNVKNIKINFILITWKLIICGIHKLYILLQTYGRNYLLFVKIVIHVSSKIR